MGPHKNPVGAIEIAKEVGLPLVLAGEPRTPAETSYFNSCVKKLIDGQGVRYVGGVNREQRRKLLAQASALLFPIMWEEPFGLVMVEAMACGTPVLALDRGSVREIVDHGTTGFYADTLSDLSKLVPKALALDRNVVRSQAQQRFSVEQMTAKYVAVFEQRAHVVST
jgi:glycosyltransferase involved in cell wall biosynthesis